MNKNNKTTYIMGFYLSVDYKSFLSEQIKMHCNVYNITKDKGLYCEQCGSKLVELKSSTECDKVYFYDEQKKINVLDGLDINKYPITCYDTNFATYYFPNQYMISVVVDDKDTNFMFNIFNENNLNNEFINTTIEKLNSDYSVLINNLIKLTSNDITFTVGLVVLNSFNSKT